MQITRSAVERTAGNKKHYRQETGRTRTRNRNATEMSEAEWDRTAGKSCRRCEACGFGQGGEWAGRTRIATRMCLRERCTPAGDPCWSKTELVRCWERGCPVLAAAPHTSSGRAVAALQLLQALQGWICGALGTAWATEIPLLLQHLAGRAESSLDSAEWEQHVLKPIEDETWSVGLSQQLSRQLGSSAPGSWQKLFLYKALGTALAGCWDLSHVQGQVLRFLQDTDSVELSEAQPNCGSCVYISPLVRAAQDLCFRGDVPALGPLSCVGKDSGKSASKPRLQDGKSSRPRSSQLEELPGGAQGRKELGTERPRATRAALMCVYSGIALHAPREQLLARVDREIMGTILRLSRVTQRETQLKLVLVQSVAEVSSAIQAVGDAGSFELSSKQEVTQPLLDWIKEEPADSGKLRPALSREENRSLRAVCCGANPSSPSQEGMKRGRTVRAALNMQLLHRRSAEGLGRLLETLLAAEEPSAGFGDVLLVNT
uniref:HEAT repeat-containing protein 7A n=1 Tax=Columba livia TaxID=8932 RepID=R7VVJ3_COLLI